MALANDRLRRKFFPEVFSLSAYAAVSFAAWLLDRNGMNTAGGILLMAAGTALGLGFLIRDASLVSIPFLLSFFWIFGEGLALLRLSILHEAWSDDAWICFTGFYILFIAAWTIFHSLRIKAPEKETLRLPDTRKLYRLVIISAAVPFLCFAAEAVILGYIPLFATFTHAYDHFHITGIHYFTVSSVFTLPLSVIFFLTWQKAQPGVPVPAKEKRAVLLANALSLAIPLLCISKLQLVQSVALAMIVFFCMKRDIPLKRLLRIVFTAAVLLAAAAAVMTLRRNYEEGYLDSIFQMRNANIPMPVQYVYMYIANNYANFNVLTLAVKDGQIAHALGMKQLFPVFALTGLKFIRPELVNYPIVTTIEELNTLTVIYDAYYDFGVFGVLAFGALFGAACGCLSAAAERESNPITYLFYAQIALYVILAFFSAWFTVPTTWFYLAVTAAAYWYLKPRALQKSGNVV